MGGGADKSEGPREPAVGAGISPGTIGHLALCVTAGDATPCLLGAPLGGMGVCGHWQPHSCPPVLGDKGKQMCVKCLWLSQLLLGWEGAITGIRVDGVQGC